jgi:uncharacterized protein YuzE
MNVIIDEGVGAVYVRIHSDPIKTEITHTMEKHGVLLHWDGHGKLMGIEFAATGEPVNIIETASLECHLGDDQ